jgi:two-component system, OmpR family, sensor histidine kinase TctE
MAGWCVWAPLDPRRSLAARVAGVVLLGTAVAWWLPGLAWLCGGVAAVAAAALAVQPWQRVTAQVHALQRSSVHQAASAAERTPLPAPALLELQDLVHALNQRMAEQHDAMDQHKRFLADASHQLRTPLAVLRTQLQSDEAVPPRLPDMLRTLDRATAVADELLSRLKVEQHQAHGLRLQSLRLDEVAKDAALEFSPLIAKARQAFELDAVPLPLQADAWMLGELVRNLLANAVRHTPPGAALGIVVRRAAGCAELIVWDSGTGLADDMRERLFEPFAAASGGTGVGLGLSICRQLALAMGAQVQLFNRSDGQRVVGLDAVVRWLPTPEPA